ncbi:MAG TPA: hypothetical protein VFL19_03760 [Nitrospira sp.]|nr:hypothetical protein [Nitrospira sp.]
MISTFDLTLLGTLVSAGGLLFLRQGKRPHLRLYNLGAGKRTIELSAEGRDHHARATVLAGARWLTVGSLTLFIAYIHGAEEGYLFGLWSDVLFHLVFVVTCWTATAYRMNQAAEKVLTVPLSMTSRGQAGT